MMKIRGILPTRQVFVNGVELLPDESQRVINHSPDGFSWGYEGSGPAQLALAILLLFMPKEEAERHHQEFKRLFVSQLPMG